MAISMSRSRSKRRSSCRKKQKELLREFEKLNEAGCNPESEGWLAKAKSFLNGAAKN